MRGIPLDGGAAASWIRDPHLSAEDLGPVAESAKARPAEDACAADAVVDDFDGQEVGILVDANRRAVSVGVFPDVGQGLADDVVGGDLDRFGKTFGEADLKANRTAALAASDSRAIGRPCSLSTVVDAAAMSRS